MILAFVNRIRLDTLDSTFHFSFLRIKKLNVNYIFDIPLSEKFQKRKKEKKKISPCNQVFDVSECLVGFSTAVDYPSVLVKLSLFTTVYITVTPLDSPG